MAGPVIRGSTAATATNSPTSPASTEVGDLVLVVHWTTNSTTIPTHTLQTGFTEIATVAHDDADKDGRLSVAYKQATSAGANSYGAYTSSVGTDFAGIVVLQIGTSDSAVVGDVNASSSHTTDIPPDPAAVTTPVDDCLVLAIGGWRLRSGATVAVTPPSGYDEVWEMAGSNNSELAVASKTVSIAGSEDPDTFADDVALNEGSCSLTIAFRPYAPNLSLAVTLGALTLSSEGTTARDLTLSSTLGALTLASEGTTARDLALSATLASLTLASEGTTARDLTLSSTLAALTLASAGTVEVNGALASSLGALTLASEGTTARDLALAVNLGALTLASEGTTARDLTLSVTLGVLTAQATALRPDRALSRGGGGMRGRGWGWGSGWSRGWSR